MARTSAAFGIPHPTLRAKRSLPPSLSSVEPLSAEGADLLDWVRHVACGPLRVPRQIYFVDELPRTDSGKVRRSDLPRLLGLDQPGVTPAGESRAEESGAGDLRQSLATWICANCPSAVKTKMPFGVSPNGNDFLPSGATTSADKIPASHQLIAQALLLCAGRHGDQRQYKQGCHSNDAHVIPLLRGDALPQVYFGSRSSSSIEMPCGPRRKQILMPGRGVCGSLVNSTPFFLRSAAMASMPETANRNGRAPDRAWWAPDLRHRLD